MLAVHLHLLTVLEQVMYSDGEQPVSLGESLVKAGYGKLQNWGLEMMSVNAFNLREAERQAKQQRIAIWRNYVVPANAGLCFVNSSPAGCVHACADCNLLMLLLVARTCTQVRSQDLDMCVWSKQGLHVSGPKAVFAKHTDAFLQRFLYRWGCSARYTCFGC